jgi:polyhydroxyalkanoate synthesis repressor PhaR
MISPIQIRRYPNRRLYDRSRRRYVTLGDIEDLVREGHTVEVRDSKTDEDLTRQVLAQILLERHPDRMATFPVAMLHGLLRANDLALDVFRAYLRQSLVALEQFPKTGPTFPTPIDWMASMFPGLAPARPPAPAHAHASASPEEMARRLAELEARIGTLEESELSPDPDPTGAVPPSRPAGDAAPLDRLEHRVSDLESRPRRKKPRAARPPRP